LIGNHAKNSKMNESSNSQKQIASLTMIAKLEYVPAYMQFIREMTTKLGLREEDAQRLELASEEACVNVIEHAFDPGEIGFFNIFIERRPTQVAVIVEDHGLPFDVNKIQNESESSLGIMLMKALTDEIHFHNLGKNGKRVELIKNLTYRDLSSYTSLEEEEKKFEVPPEITDGSQIEIRLMRPDDSINLARCMYRCYGYTYVNGNVYFPDKTRELLQSGLLTSYISIAPDGEIVGHIACTRESANSPIGELGQAVVDPRYRGYGLLNKMNGMLQRNVKDQGILGMYSEAVTVHPYTQKSLLAYGGHETGVLLGFTSDTMFFKRIQSDEKPNRRAAILYYNRVNEEPLRRVYSPFHHHSMIARILKENGLKREIVEARELAITEELPPTSQLDIKVQVDASRGFMRVIQYGADIVSLVKFRLHELCLRRVDCIYLDLPLSELFTAKYCASFELLGFFFGGIIPELKNGDVLRLQYLNNVDVDSGSIKIESEFGKELTAYVLKLRES
jgi:anti-sigma regulatory factor (Ser/Thr protein kinase)